jgi:hypothetical protein
MTCSNGLEDLFHVSSFAMSNRTRSVGSICGAIRSLLCTQSTTDSGFTYAFAAAAVQLIGNLLKTGLRALGRCRATLRCVQASTLAVDRQDCAEAESRVDLSLP